MRALLLRFKRQKISTKQNVASPKLSDSLPKLSAPYASEKKEENNFAFIYMLVTGGKTMLDNPFHTKRFVFERLTGTVNSVEQISLMHV